jgi:hypothetical protein
MAQMNLQQALKYNPKELYFIIEPKNEEEMIALSRATSVIDLLQKEIKNIKID